MRKILSWLRTGRRSLWAAAIIVILIILSVVIKPIANYATAQPQNATVVAALIALLGILVTQIVNTILARTGQRNQQEIEERRARAASLQAYLEQMGELLLNHQLGSSDIGGTLSEVGWAGTPLVGRRIGNVNPEGENPWAVAQAHTFAVLEGLDPTRKRFLVQFLYYSALITKGKASISLAGGNLSRASLSDAYLSEAFLSGAFLNYANLSWAILNYANLSGAKLSEAMLSGGKLSKYASLKGATMPDGSKHD